MGVASDRYFLHGTNKEKKTLYKEYHKVHPDWTICGDADPESKKYWKWVFAKFNSVFAEYYSSKKADGISEEWSKYTLEDIRKDIEDNYHIQVDASTLKTKSLLQRVKTKFVALVKQ